MVVFQSSTAVSLSRYRYRDILVVSELKAARSSRAFKSKLKQLALDVRNTFVRQPLRMSVHAVLAVRLNSGAFCVQTVETFPFWRVRRSRWTREICNSDRCLRAHARRANGLLSGSGINGFNTAFC